MGQINLNMYEANRMLMSRVDKITEQDKKEAIKKINNYHRYMKNTYYLLLNHELRYVTLLGIVNINKETLGEAVIECLENIGELIQIDEDNYNGVFECWVRINDVVHCILLFAYDSGVVKVGGTK